MPTWLTILVSVVSLLSVLLGILGLTAYINERMKHKAEKRNKEEDSEEEKIKKMEHEELVREIQNIISKSFEPVMAELSEIRNDVHKVKKGVQVTCRNDLEELADKAEKQGFLPRYDKDRFEAEYLAYHDLGKNGVMDATYKRIMNLPDSKLTTSKKSKKTILLEDK